MKIIISIVTWGSLCFALPCAALDNVVKEFSVQGHPLTSEEANQSADEDDDDSSDDCRYQRRCFWDLEEDEDPYFREVDVNTDYPSKHNDPFFDNLSR